MDVIYIGSNCVCTHGAQWHFGYAEDEPATCDVCGEEVWDGWQCLDGGEVVCSEHVEAVPDWLRDARRAEHEAAMRSHNRLVGMRCIVGLSALQSFRAEHTPGRFLGFVRPA